MRKSLLFVAFAVLGGCGIPGDTKLMDLTPEQADKICNHAVDPDATDRTVSCGDPIGDITIPATTLADCTDYFANVLTTANPDCTATFDQWVSCKEEPDLTDGQICGTEEYTPSADCVAVVTCVTPVTE